MYSIYRAWLSLNPCTGLPFLPEITAPLNLTIPTQPSPQIPEAPDVTLQVGPNMTQFSAHKAVLSAHSGYFKAALVNYTDLLPLTVSNVNVEEFTALLTFMYTGFLDLNITNIYNILLATHILHMPTALELCRNFLLQQNQHPVPEQRVNIIKPIASKKMTPHLQEIFTPNAFGGLNQSKDTLFRTVRATTSSSAATTTTTAAAAAAAALTNDGVFHHHRTTSKTEIKSSNSQHDEKRKINGKSYVKKRTDSTSSSSMNDSKTIIDIACCDGPVRFHRVINKSYGLRNTDNFNQISFKTTDAINKAINENIAEKLQQGGEQQSNEIFTCVYCNHTFKSQYCYQKHARRHLYPATIDTASTPTQQQQLPLLQPQQPSEMTTKKETKLLDMNVQYYPCKTCGSKFPSYYFVHKHRKMCHSDEIAPSDKNNRNTEENNGHKDENCNNSNGGSTESNRNSNNSNSSSSSSSAASAIDVEAVQNGNEPEVT